MKGKYAYLLLITFHIYFQLKKKVSCSYFPLLLGLKTNYFKYNDVFNISLVASKKMEKGKENT